MLRLLGFLTLLVLVLFVVGLFAGWFSIAEAGDGDRTNVTVGVDKKAIQRDIDEVKREVEERFADTQRVSGTVVSVDPAARRIVLNRPGVEDLVLSVADTAAVTIDGRDASLGDVRRGDVVEARVADANEARQITVRRD